jgi:UDP-N-acetylglucosamine 4,6-dehydratase/5-epimerase
MITEADGLNTLEFDRHFVILPSTPQLDPEQYRRALNGRRCEFGFKYTGTNNEWLNVEELRELIRKHVDSNFRVV